MLSDKTDKTQNIEINGLKMHQIVVILCSLYIVRLLQKLIKSRMSKEN